MSEIKKKLSSIIDGLHFDLTLAINKHLIDYSQHGYKLILFMLVGAGATMSVFFSNIREISDYVSSWVISIAFLFIILSGIIGFIGLIVFMFIRLYGTDIEPLINKLDEKYASKFEQFDHLGEIKESDIPEDTLLGYSIKNKIIQKKENKGDIEYPVDSKLAIASFSFLICIFFQMLFFLLFWISVGLGVVF